MADKEDLKAIERGIQAWNAWRGAHLAKAPDLSKALLVLTESGQWNFQGCNLSGATLRCSAAARLDCSGANLADAIFESGSVIQQIDLGAGAVLDGVSFEKATLKDVDFRDATLTRVSFAGAILKSVTFKAAVVQDTSFLLSRLCDAIFGGTLKHVEFGRARLETVDFADVRFVGSSFAAGDAKKCKFNGTDFQGTENPSTLENARFADCSFQDAKLNGTSIRSAQFVDCDLRRVSGLVFDDTMVRGSPMSSGADDAWSVLRRSYTGANMVFNLILLAAFFLPTILEGIFWTGMNRAQLTLLTAARSADSRLTALPADPQIEALRVTLQSLAAPELKRCLGGSNANERSSPERDRILVPGAGGRPGCFSIWQVLLGMHEGILASVLAAILVVYNASRLLLTRFVAPLLDEERRSWHTPAREQYEWLLPFHRIVSVGFYVAVLAFLAHVVPRLFGQVWIGV